MKTLLELVQEDIEYWDKLEFETLEEAVKQERERRDEEE